MKHGLTAEIAVGITCDLTDAACFMYVLVVK